MRDDESLVRIEELAGVATMRALIAEQLRVLPAEHRAAIELRIVAALRRRPRPPWWRAHPAIALLVVVALVAAPAAAAASTGRAS